MTDITDLTDTNSRPIPTQYVITCWCGHSWRVDGGDRFVCSCGTFYSDIRTEPTFMFNIDEPPR